MIRLTVEVKTNAKRCRIAEVNGIFYISVTETPIEGKANSRVIELLSEHLHKPKSLFKIIRGSNTKHKIIEIAE